MGKKYIKILQANKFKKENVSLKLLRENTVRLKFGDAYKCMHK